MKDRYAEETDKITEKSTALFSAEQIKSSVVFLEYFIIAIFYFCITISWSDLMVTRIFKIIVIVQ